MSQDRLTDAALEELERLHREATPGPCNCGHDPHKPGRCRHEVCPAFEDGNSWEPAEYCDCGKVSPGAYGAFCGAADRNIPALLSELRSLRTTSSDLFDECLRQKQRALEAESELASLRASNEKMRAENESMRTLMKLEDESGMLMFTREGAAIICNDHFAPAADCEQIPLDLSAEVYALWQADPRPDTLYAWVRDRRAAEAVEPITNSKKGEQP